MELKNLKQNKCPKCSSDLNYDSKTDLLYCENKECMFTLLPSQFSDYLDDLEQMEYHIPDEEENLSGLNNL